MERRDEKSHIYYEIYPKIIPADKESNIYVKPIAKPKFEGDFQIEIFSMESRRKKSYSIRETKGILEISHYFEGEQEHLVHIYKESILPENKQCILHIYSMFEDLYVKRPYKGDFHIHTSCSDGSETPEAVCAFARKAGLDVIAITDHGLYSPSLRAKEFINDINSDLKIFPGEEIHFHGREHILSLVGNEGLGERYWSEKIYKREIALYREKIRKEINKAPQKINKDRYTACKFVIEKIHDVKGLAIMPHPFWIQTEGYHNAGELFNYMYCNNEFDVFELINGYEEEVSEGESNNIQITYYNQRKALGNALPMISGTDAHSVVSNKNFGNMYTVIFCEDFNLEQVKKNIIEGNTVVVSANKPCAAGKLRYVKYAHYLIREVFPLHDEICFEEGRAMLRIIACDGDAINRYNFIKGGVNRLYSKLWQ